MTRNEITLLVVIVIIVLVTMKVVQMWNKSYAKMSDNTAIAVFDSSVEIEELPQHHIETHQIEGVTESEFRAFNPSLTLLHDKMVYSYRVSNFVGCQAGSDKAVRNITGINDSVKNYIMLSLEDQDVIHLDIPEVSASKCVMGFEDPRLMTSPDGSTFYVIANGRPTAACTPEMYLISIPTSDLEAIFESDLPNKTLKVANSQLLRLKPVLSESEEVQKPRPQKNWMPFFAKSDPKAKEESLMFVYSVNPHIVLKCDMETGNCTVVGDTFNEDVNPELRGSSQARLYNDKFIAVAHWRTSGHSYLSQAYMFSKEAPFAIEAISPTFVIEDVKMKAMSMIQFVSGLEIQNETAYITYGEHDCDSKLFKVSMEALLASMTEV
jgi:hypothetical protein